MPHDGSRLLYLARHAEPTADGANLTDRGERQAELLGQRVAGLGLSRIVHGPLPRARETARVVAAQLADPPELAEVDAAGDYVPPGPHPQDLPNAWADAVLSSFADVTEGEASEGVSLASRATELFAGPPGEGRQDVELVITHAFTIGWLVRHALDAPAWRWWGLDQCHAGITVIRYRPDRPPSVVVSNDVSHLTPDLRWTGFPEGVGA